MKMCVNVCTGERSDGRNGSRRKNINGGRGSLLVSEWNHRRTIREQKKVLDVWGEVDSFSHTDTVQGVNRDQNTRDTDMDTR